MGTFATVKELGISFLSFSILCSIVHLLSKMLKIRYNGFKFSNPKKSALHAIIAITISSFMVIGLMVLLTSQNTSEISSDIQKYNLSIVTNFAISWLILLSPVLIVKKMRNESWESTGISKHNLKASILIGIILAIITVAYAILFSSKSINDISHSLTLSSLWALVYYAIVGFCEEFMFRGYLQIRMMGWLGKWKGWILTSIFMALVHIPQRMASMGLSPREAILSSCLLIPISLTMGYILVKTENIAASAIYHTFANWISVLM